MEKYFFFLQIHNEKLLCDFPPYHLLGLAAATANAHIQLFACGFQFKYNLISTRARRVFDTLAHIYTFG